MAMRGLSASTALRSRITAGLSDTGPPCGGAFTDCGGSDDTEPGFAVCMAFGCVCSWRDLSSCGLA